MRVATRRRARYAVLVGLIYLGALAPAGSVPGGSSIAPPEYTDHTDLLRVIDGGEPRAVQGPADWGIRRKHVIGHLEEVLGPLPDDAWRVPLDVRVVEEERTGAIVRRKLVYSTDPTPHGVAAHLFLPAGVPAPAVLCLHQTVDIGKDEPAGLGGDPELDYARELAERGFVTLAPDYPSFGESTFDFADSLGYASGSMKAVWDNIRAVDLLASMPEVDPNAIGCLGHSLGAHNALFTAAFEPRLRAVVSSAGFTRFAEFRAGELSPWSRPFYMPAITIRYGNDPERVPFDFPEVLATVAPRPLLAIAPLRDRTFPEAGARAAIDAARQVYALFDAAELLESYHPRAGHAFSDSSRQRAYAFLERHLKRQ